MREFLRRLVEYLRPEAVPYGKWRKHNQADQAELARQKKDQEIWLERPLISIVVPAYQTQERFLREMIASVCAQTYTNWQLCIADGSTDDCVRNVILEYQNAGCNIVYRKLQNNQGIAENTNAAVQMAEGAWIGFLDHDDLLAPEALYEVAKAIINKDPVDMLYTDEDKVAENSRKYFEPHLKPDFSLDLLRSNNYITHFLVIRRELLEKTDGFRKEFDGAQDYDFILRCAEEARRIVHIPKILYHWRVHALSTSENPESKLYAFQAGKRALETHLLRQGVKADVTMRKGRELGFYDVRYQLEGQPLVSILIPNKDQVETLEKCLHSIEASTYPNVEIIIIENNSVQSETFRYYETLDKCRYPIRVVHWEKDFNYSAINNYGVSFAKGDYLVLLNNDVEILNPQWLEEMLGNCQRPEVGIVGAKLYYPDDTIQHAGVVLGMGAGFRSAGVAGGVFTGLRRSEDGYLHKASIQLNYSAVTAACMMTKRSVYQEVGSMEEKLAVAFNDIDYCLKVGRAGYLVVYDPRVEGYHYESKTRGKEDTPEKVQRFQAEVDYMRERWGAVLQRDPYYNPNWSLHSSYMLRMKKIREYVKIAYSGHNKYGIDKNVKKCI